VNPEPLNGYKKRNRPFDQLRPERGKGQAKIPSTRGEKLSLSAEGGLSFLPFFREGEGRRVLAVTPNCSKSGHIKVLFFYGMIHV